MTETRVEKRLHPRHKTFKAGKIIHHKGLLNQPCLVRDVSMGGAKLQIDPPFECPEKFLLELINQAPRSCQVVWQIGEHVGARYVQPRVEGKLPARVARWKAAWESGQAIHVAALYTADCRHHSANVPILFPERTKTGLVGTADIRDYAANAFLRFTSLEITMISVTETDDRSVIEYNRTSDPDGGTPVPMVEVLEWSGNLIREARVYHA